MDGHVYSRIEVRSDSKRTNQFQVADTIHDDLLREYDMHRLDKKNVYGR